MRDDSARLSEGSAVGAQLHVVDGLKWHCHTLLRKFHGDSVDPSDLFDEIEIMGNALMYGGASNFWEYALGNGSGTAAQALTFLNNGNTYIGVGDSATAAAATQTDLQASSNKLRKAMDASYPSHTDGVVVGAASCAFRSTFGTSDANWTWNEWGIFNGASGGRMLNRKVEALGAKTSAATWQLTLTLTLG